MRTPPANPRRIRDTLQALALAVAEANSPGIVALLNPQDQHQGWSPSALRNDRSVLIAVRQAVLAGASVRQLAAITGLPIAVINGVTQYGAGSAAYSWRG